jgi:hypothetical protein
LDVQIKKYKLSYDAIFKMDPEFGAPVLGLFDLTFFQLSDACLWVKTIEDVDFGQICSSSKCADVLQNCFQAHKPVYLLSTPKSPRNEDDNGPEGHSSKKNKQLDLKNKDNKDKLQNRDLGEMVKNPHSVQYGIFTGGKYKEAFMKEIIASSPLFNESGVVACNNWHVIGFCYKKCNRHNFHKKFESATHKCAYVKWLWELKAKHP